MILANEAWPLYALTSLDQLVTTMFGLNFFLRLLKKLITNFLDTWKNGAVAIILIANGVSNNNKNYLDGTIIFLKYGISFFFENSNNFFSKNNLNSSGSFSSNFFSL